MTPLGAVISEAIVLHYGRDGLPPARPAPPVASLAACGTDRDAAFRLVPRQSRPIARDLGTHRQQIEAPPRSDPIFADICHGEAPAVAIPQAVCAAF